MESRKPEREQEGKVGEKWWRKKRRIERIRKEGRKHNMLMLGTQSQHPEQAIETWQFLVEMKQIKACFKKL